MKKHYYLLLALCIVVSLLFAAGRFSSSARSFEGEKYYQSLPYVNHGIYIKESNACFEGFVNGGFETTTGWQIPITEYSAGYSSARARTGTWSMRTGITLAADNRYSYSDARQVVTIPADSVAVKLTMWLFPISTDTNKEIAPMLEPGQTFGEAALVGDLQYILVLDRYDRIVQTLLWQRSNAQVWTEVSYDLSAYRGQTIKIQYGTYNDGFDGITAMYVDDASLEICNTSMVQPTATGTPPTPTWTATVTNTPVPPTATATLPAGCYQAVGNGDFEGITSWYMPITEYTASYSSAVVHGGTRSMRTGILTPLDNRFSYSSGQQTVTIPTGISSAVLSFWVYPISTELAAKEEELPKLGETFVEEAMAGDVQYALVLDAYNNILRSPVWQKTNTRTWELRTIDLASLAGRTVKLHFGTYNDGLGGITAMYFDDVSLLICPTGGTVPTATVTPPPTTTATPSGACYNLLANSNFEATSSWQIPLTEYSAGYSTAQARSPVRSMRTGITLPADNRYSYSDAWQTVIVPPNATSVTLRFSTFPVSGEVTEKALPETKEGFLFGEEALAGDVQYFLILDRYGYWIDTVLWQRLNTQAWTTYAVDLRAYRGWTIRLQFGTYNDGWGGITAMYVDDVSFDVCP